MPIRCRCQASERRSYYEIVKKNGESVVVRNGYRRKLLMRAKVRLTRQAMAALYTDLLLPRRQCEPPLSSRDDGENEQWPSPAHLKDFMRWGRKTAHLSVVTRAHDGWPSCGLSGEQAAGGICHGVSVKRDSVHACTRGRIGRRRKPRWVDGPFTRSGESVRRDLLAHKKATSYQCLFINQASPNATRAKSPAHLHA